MYLVTITILCLEDAPELNLHYPGLVPISGFISHFLSPDILKKPLNPFRQPPLPPPTVDMALDEHQAPGTLKQSEEAVAVPLQSTPRKPWVRLIDSVCHQTTNTPWEPSLDYIKETCLRIRIAKPQSLLFCRMPLFIYSTVGKQSL